MPTQETKRTKNVPEEILGNLTGQIRQVLPVKKRIDEYTEAQRTTFPKLFDWPEDYVMNYGRKQKDDS